MIASRYQKGAAVQGLESSRRLLSEIAGFYYSVIIRVPNVKDYTCGYRLYTHTALCAGWKKYAEKLVECHTFACMMELLFKLYKSGCHQGVLYGEGPNEADIDVAAQGDWLAQKYDISEYSEDQIRKAKTGSFVFVTADVTFCDAIEDLRFGISMN